MKEIKPGLKVIITSGHAMDGDIGELLSEGVLAFLQKPFEIEQLARTVQKALSSFL
jgi:DNA-binding NtrC family response regulator